MKPYNQVFGPIAIALALLGILTPAKVITTFIVLGQAHFTLAYLYQIRAGKITRYYCFRYLLAALAIGVFLILTDFSTRALLLLTGSIFSAHFIADEMHLLELRWSPLTKGLSVLFTLTYGSYILAQTYGIDISPYSACLLLGIALLYAWIHRSFREWYFSALSITLCAVLLLQPAIAYEKVLASIILLHYARWYVCYYHLVRAGTPRIRYLWDVAMTNTLIIAGYILYSHAPASPFPAPLWGLFDLRCFYVWTLLHIVASLRVPKQTS